MGACALVGIDVVGALIFFGEVVHGSYWNIDCWLFWFECHGRIGIGDQGGCGWWGLSSVLGDCGSCNVAFVSWNSVVRV